MPKNIPVMLSSSGKGEHYNGLGGVCEGGTASKREAETERVRKVARKAVI